MKRFILSGIFLFVFLFSFSQTTFQKVYGGNQNESGGFVLQTSDGGYMLAGTTESYGMGGKDFYLVKTNSNGDTLWTRTYGTTNDDQLVSIEQTRDGGYIMLGTTNYQGIYVVKINVNDSVSWSNTYRVCEQEVPYAIQQTKDGGYLVSGIGDSEDIATPKSYTFLIKLHPSGIVNWEKEYYVGYVFTPYCPAKEVSSGGYILAGNDFLIRTDVTGNLLWTKFYNSNEFLFVYDVRETTSGGFEILSEKNLLYGHLQTSISRVGNNGNEIWSRIFGAGNFNLNPDAFTLDANGNCFLAADVQDSLSDNGCLAKIDSTGQLLWSNIYLTNQQTSFSSIALTNDGGIAVGGIIQNAITSTDAGSLYFLKTDGNGNSSCGQTPFAPTVSVSSDTISNYTMTISSFCLRQPIFTFFHSGGIAKDICSLGINNPTENTISTKVFPNPFSEKTTIEISGMNANEKLEFEMFDVNGNVVRDFYFTGNEIEVERNNLSSGIYFYKIMSNEKIISTGKLVTE